MAGRDPSGTGRFGRQPEPGKAVRDRQILPSSGGISSERFADSKDKFRKNKSLEDFLAWLGPC
jgi:hypothetical protein